MSASNHSYDVLGIIELKTECFYQALS